jgi:phytoene dehydrogenase-like protein
MATNRYDAIVIGAGANGLIAATALAKAGRRTVILERRPVVGGIMTTEEFAPGFRVDAAVHDIGWITDRVARELHLDRNGLKLVTPSTTTFTPLPDGEALELSIDPVKSANSIRRFSPSDAGTYAKFANRMVAIAGILQLLYDEPPPDIATSSPTQLVPLLKLGRRVRGLGKVGIFDLLRTLPMSITELLDDNFENDALKGTLGAGGISGLMQGPRAGGTSFLFLHNQVGRPAGALRARAIAKGGAGAFTQALADAARRNGVEIRLGADVARIIARDDSVNGVTLESGEEIAAPMVFSSADPKLTLLTLLGATELEPELVRALMTVKYKGAAAKVHLALAELPRFRGHTSNTEALQGAISISPSLTYLEKAYDAAKHRGISDAPYMEARVPTIHDPSLAPANRHVMSVHVQYAPYRLDGGWSEERREALGDTVVRVLGEYAPNVPGAVLHRHVVTPADMEKKYGLPEGNLGQGELTLDQILFMRPTPELARYRTPIDGLFLCGSGTHPGTGLPGIAALNAVRVAVGMKKR